MRKSTGCRCCRQTGSADLQNVLVAWIDYLFEYFGIFEKDASAV